MSASQLKTYIERLQVGEPDEEIVPEGFGIDTEGPVAAPLEYVDVDTLPTGIVTGSNLIAFDPATPNVIRSSVALSLLAAQRVATKDGGITTPKQWLDKHNEVLTNLNWVGDGGAVVESTLKGNNVAVHQAILPLLTAAFGPAIAAGAIILTALKQLQEMDKGSSWITLFDRQSRHFDVTEYQFSAVDIQDGQAVLRIASARFNAAFGHTQVLFFRLKQENVQFESASGTFRTDTALLQGINGDLKAKLLGFSKAFIAKLPDDLGVDQ